MQNYGRKNGKLKFIVTIIILTLIIFGVYHIFSSQSFKRDKPVVNLSGEVFWNLKSPIELKIKDSLGIKSLKISLSDGLKSEVIVNEKFKDRFKEISYDINFPKNTSFDKKGNYRLFIEVTDASKWNFFTGNKIKENLSVKIDTVDPQVEIVNNSYSITKGGVAAVVFKATDDNLKDVYVDTNFGRKFQVVPFYKSGYYVALIPWPIFENSFEANVVAVDKAGNTTKQRVRLFTKNKIYKNSTIVLTKSFLDGKISDLYRQYSNNSTSSLDKKFVFVNNTLRDKNEGLIYEVTKGIREKVIESFYIEPFKPLKNAAAVASYGDHRFYTYNGNSISNSYHMGIDFASTKEADIISSNPGVVVFDKENGIYGNNLIIYHGLGLYSLYGHCSTLKVETKDNIKKDEIIAKTGVTGLALGDHLHFTILVQGVEVRPEEWMDKSWMRDNIYKILDDSKKIIDKK